MKINFDENEYIVTEGVEGCWHYHISNIHTVGKALCGANTMYSHLSFNNWGHVGHLRERYCSLCERMARESENNS